MISHKLNMDQWPDWEQKIFGQYQPAVIISIDHKHPNYADAIAALRAINNSHHLLILNYKDYKKIFRDGESYEDPPCIQVFSHGVNSGHYTIEDLIEHTTITQQCIDKDLRWS